MYYFIPSWYQNERKWYDDTRYWFRVIERMTFDDTVNQIKMFQRAGEDAGLVLLNYQPNLRYFLHKQDLMGTAYWSFFDDVQNIKRVKQEIIDFKSLNWPAGTYFAYGPFLIVAKCEDKEIARVQFAEDGNLLCVEFVEEGRPVKTYIFDDRGFLSSILYFDEQGQATHQDYLNQYGVWQIRESLSDGTLVINKNADKTFQSLTYNNWEELLLERLARFEQTLLTESDCLVIAANSQHNTLFTQTCPRQQKVFSFFDSRYDMESEADFPTIVEAASLLIVDNSELEEKLKAKLLADQLPPRALTRISPFDTRLRLGQSQTIKELIIHFFIDGMSAEDLGKTLHLIFGLMEKNKYIFLRVVTFDKSYNLKALEEEVTHRLQTYFDSSLFFEAVEDEGENQVDESDEMQLSRIAFSCLNNENEVIMALDTTRVVVDLGEKPDLYTQIASISAGVPQINLVQTDYVSHRKNGWILSSLDDIIPALDYYFDGLTNWNHSLVYTVEKMADYTSGRLVSQWKQLLKKEA